MDNTHNTTRTSDADSASANAEAPGTSTFSVDEFFDDLQCSWSSATAAALLDPTAIKELDRKWVRLSDQRKIRSTMAFFHLKGRIRLDAQGALESIINKTEKDPNEFLVKLSRLLRSFISTGIIDVTEIDSETAWRIVSEMENESECGPVPCFTNSQSYPWMAVVPSKMQMSNEIATPAGSSINLFQALDGIRELLPYEVPSKVNFLINEILQDDVPQGRR